MIIVDKESSGRTLQEATKLFQNGQKLLIMNVIDLFNYKTFMNEIQLDAIIYCFESMKTHSTANSNASSDKKKGLVALT